MPPSLAAAAFSFDCYGTLIDWETGIIAAVRAWLGGRCSDLDDEAILAAHARLEPAAESAEPGARYPDVLADVLRGLGAELGVAVTDAEARTFGASVGDWPAFPDSPAALARLATGSRLIILSNVDRASFARSEARLGVRFDAIVTAEDVGSYKPDPRNFEALLAAAAGLRIPPGGLVHVAQSLYHDHVPAKAIGLPTVWIDRRAGRSGSGATPTTSGEIRPDWTFGSLAAFADAVERARGAVAAAGDAEG